MGPRIREDKGRGMGKIGPRPRIREGRLSAGITGESRGRRERLIPRCSAVSCAIANTRWERLLDDMLSVPG